MSIFLFFLQLLVLWLLLPLFLSRNFYMMLISIIIFSVISKDTSWKVTSFPWIQERRKIHSVQINPGNSQRKRHWIRVWWERKWKTGKGGSSTCFSKPGHCSVRLNPTENIDKQPIYSMFSRRLFERKRQVTVKVTEAVSNRKTSC